ncbi:MAG: phytanoyl-CoA dioxygenase family protein [Alphaproteobacteria bacterium]|nr:phytanoyl-CoA dioxygenase family protein [Alphaproteobacteria bacterium]
MNALAAGDPTENDLHAGLSADEAREVAAALPLAHRFTLGTEITPVQLAFLDLHGFLVFAQVATQEEVDAILAAVDEVQTQFLAEGRQKAHGVPIWVGRDEHDAPYIQRFAYLSMFSDTVRRFVTDDRFEPVRKLIGADARIGHDELDGVVFNRYVKAAGSLRPQLGWHTDGLRDVFYGELPGPMLNVGLHFRRIRVEDGGLRLIPGTHKQGYWGFVFRKLYFLDHRPDAEEIPVETFPGDLTVHDGRLWHRVAASRYEGARSRRESMYVPYVTGIRKPQTEDSETKGYMKVLNAGMRLKAWLVRKR